MKRIDSERKGGERERERETGCVWRNEKVGCEHERESVCESERGRDWEQIMSCGRQKGCRVK